MQRLSLIPLTEIRFLLQQITEGDFDVFCTLMPRLLDALPLVRQQAGDPPTTGMDVKRSGDRLALLKLYAIAASRGLALVAQGTSSSSSSSSSGSLPAPDGCSA